MFPTGTHPRFSSFLPEKKTTSSPPRAEFGKCMESLTRIHCKLVDLLDSKLMYARKQALEKLNPNLRLCCFRNFNVPIQRQHTNVL